LSRFTTTSNPGHNSLEPAVVFEQSFVVLSEKVEPTKFEHERARPDEERDEDQKPNEFLRAHAGLHDAAQHHERNRRDRDAERNSSPPTTT
jgi:hypothetical protein